MERRWPRVAAATLLAAGAALALLLLTESDVQAPVRASLRAQSQRVGSPMPPRDPVDPGPAAVASAVDAAASIASGGDVAAVPAAPIEEVEPAPGPLQGRVLLDGRPWRGALRWTRVGDPATLRVETGAAGAFELPAAEGSWLVSFEGAPADVAVWAMFELAEVTVSGSPGGVRWSRGLAVRVGPGEMAPDVPEDWQRVGAGGAGRLWIDLATPATLELRVVEAASGRLLPDARVVLRPEHDGRPDDSAAVRLELGPDGLYRTSAPRWCAQPEVTIEADGLGSQVFVWERPQPLGAPERVEVRLRRTITVRGRFLDADGRPITGGEVWLSTLSDAQLAGRRSHMARVVTDDDGAFRFEAVGLGSAGPNGAAIYVHGRTPDHRWAPQVELEVGASSPPIELRLRRWVPLAGRVLGPAGPGAATVTATANEARGTFELPWSPNRSDGQSRRAGPDGAFAFERVPERCWLLVEAPGLAPAAFEVRCPLEAPLVVQLEPEVTLEGRAVNADDSPARGVAVWAVFHGTPVHTNVDAEERRPVARLERPGWRRLDLAVEGGRRVSWSKTDEQGWFRLGGLPRGARFDVQAGRWNSEPARSVAPGEPLLLRADLPLPRAVIRAQIVDEAGAPLQGWITVRDAQHAYVEVEGLPAPRPASFDPARDEEPEWPAGVVEASARGAGPLLVVFEVEGRPRVGRRVVLRDGGAVDLGRVAVPRGGGRPALRVRWPDGPAPRLEVRWVDPASGAWLYERPENPADADAPILLAPTNAGSTTLRVAIVDPACVLPDRPVAEVPAVIRAGEVSEVEVDLRREVPAVPRR